MVARQIPFAPLLLACLLLAGGFRDARAEDYRLDVGDVLGVAILEREAAGGDYRVGADGMVSLPGIGRIDARGLSPREFEDALRALAAEKIVDPSVSVQVLRFRPVYVLGAVRQAGDVDWTPGMTVLQALALSGGLGRELDDASLTVELSELGARKSLEGLLAERLATGIRLARIEAELAGRDRFEAPEGVEQGVELDALMTAEQGVLEARTDGFRRQRTRINATLTASLAELESYALALETQDEYLAQVRIELDEARDLRARGIMPTDRLNQLIRAEIAARSQILQIRSLQRQSDVSVSRSRQELATLEADYRRELNDQRQAARERITFLESQIAGERRILAEMGARTAGGREIGEFAFQLYRDGALHAGGVQLTDRMQPGDTLIVTRSDMLGEDG